MRYTKKLFEKYRNFVKSHRMQKIFPQNFRTRRLGEITVFFVVKANAIKPFLANVPHFIAPENTRKTKVFRSYKMGTLDRYGLFYCLQRL